MKPLYSSKELAKIYNRVKIQYNPSGYSFRDRLVEVDTLRTNYNNCMDNISYETEGFLINKIASAWKEAVATKPYGAITIPNIEYNNFMTKFTEIKGSVSNLLFNLHECVFVKADHLAFVPNYLSKSVDPKIDLKKSNIVDTLVIILYLMTTSKSICKDLKWASTHMPDTYTYEILESMQFLKDALESKNLDEMYVNHYETPFDVNIVPVPIEEKATSPAQSFATSKGIDDTIMDMSKLDKEAIRKIIYLRYTETIAFGIEIVYIINRYLETYVNRQLYEILTGTMSKTFNPITELIYKSDKCVFEPVINLSDDPQVRFSQICNYIESDSVYDTAMLAADNFVNKITYYPVPSLFGAVISYGMDYSCRCIRTKQCAILYNYCRKNKILKDESSDLEYLKEACDFKDLLDDIDSETSSYSESDEKRRSMLDIKDAKSTGKPKPGGEHYSSSVSQALDGLINNFRTEKYGFTVKEVYNDDDSAKAKYDAIVSKIKLVNTRLIKQIREIKTYNVGGKYAGLASGKLDRKNIHKYKTDKNIFYQNTYKQKECDLAFGIVLDASGSMCGQGIDDGRTTMIVLHETLKALGINHSIIDHTCYGAKYTSDLRRYQCFKEDKGYKLRKNYALATIKAESGNCDSGALWFMEKALLRTKNKDKICLIFSDGAPTECTGTDLVEQVRHMEKHGIKVIGIGVNFPEISRYYSNYANGRNLKEMLDIVADILKEYVLTKKD